MWSGFGGGVSEVVRFVMFVDEQRIQEFRKVVRKLLEDENWLWYNIY